MSLGGSDFTPLRRCFGIVNNLTKNFFAVLSFQWPRTVAHRGLGLLIRSVSWCLAGTRRARVPYAIALVRCFSFITECGQVGRSGNITFPASRQHQLFCTHCLLFSLRSARPQSTNQPTRG